MSFEKEILNRLESKFWDFPTDVDEMRIVSYDANFNPLIVEYYFTNKLKFTYYFRIFPRFSFSYEKNSGHSLYR